MDYQTIYLIRHAETTMPGRFCGSTNVGLSANGFKQAKKLSHYFKSVPLDTVHHSGMLRTQLTASHVYANKDIPIIPSEDMREYHFGEWESHDFPYVKNTWPELYSKWTQTPFRVKIPGAETYPQFSRRVKRFGNYLKRLKHKNSAVVAHGGSLAVLMMSLFKKTSPNIWKWLPSPASITIIRRPFKKLQSNFKLVLLKDTSHL